jgi:hypothetical protein
MSAPDIVERLETRIRPLLEEGVRELRTGFPGISFLCASYPVGTKTTFQGHGFSLECLLPAVGEAPDTIALEIIVRGLTTEPRYDAVDVCWGSPSGAIEASLGLDEAAVDDTSLTMLERGIPQLLTALRRALERGTPP